MICEVQIFFYIDLNEIPYDLNLQDNSLVCPMVLIEDGSHVEFRDCGIKAMKLDESPFGSHHYSKKKDELIVKSVKSTPKKEYFRA